MNTRPPAATILKLRIHSVILCVLLPITPLYSLPPTKTNTRYQPQVQPIKYFEAPPFNLRASKTTPQHLLRGPYHSIREEVYNDGYFNSYTISSKFGSFSVEGNTLLETRIAELIALAELDKLSSSSVFLDASYKAGKGILLAPVNVVKKTAETLSDPQKIRDTLSAVPEGAERLFSWVYRQGKSAVNAVSSSNSGSERSTPKESTNKSTVSDTMNKGANLGLKYIGYTKRQLEWFRKLKVNPYTSNQILRDEVMRVAAIETAVGTIFKFVPGLGLLGELNTVNSWYERAERLALYEAPDVIADKNRAELKALGVQDETIKAFLSNTAYNPWSRRFISNSLTAIGADVAGHEEFIRSANIADNEPTTLYFVAVAEALELRHRRAKLAKIIANGNLPAAISAQGFIYLPLCVDHLFWTAEVAGILSTFKATLAKIRAGTASQSTKQKAALGAEIEVEIRCGGKISIRAEEGIRSLLPGVGIRGEISK